MTKISCITTVYNDGPDLMCSVRSVLSHAPADLEYLIVDDGSGADTAAILAELDDPRITILPQANDGLSSARNRALAHATGEYVCFLDADDIRAPWSFAAMARAVAGDTPPDVVFCRGVLSEIRGDLLNFYDIGLYDRIERLVGEDVVATGDAEAALVWPMAQLLEPQSANKLVRRALLLEHRIGFPNGHFFEDIYFHSLVLAHAERIAFIHSPLFAYFRRYGRPQITVGSGERRFDILAVAKLTMERFAKVPAFHDPIRRTALVAALAKIIRWCEESVSHQHRFHFNQVTRGLTRLVDPIYFNAPRAVAPELAPVLGHAAYLGELAHGGR